MVLVKVKHGKNSYDVELDQAKSVLDFKTMLQSLTNVPPERQTLMSKGLWVGTLKDDKDLSSIGEVKAGHLVTLMGTADALKEIPKDVSTRKHKRSFISR
jgi:ubiquitin carboxyl-terminal hydrolase 14